MITADQAIATAQQWEAEKAAGPSALVGRALLAHINSLASPQVTDEQIMEGVKALLCATSSEVEGYSPNMLSGYQDEVRRVFMAMSACALSVPPAAETPPAPLTDTFVQTVPDQCDRILWRGGYHHLPIAAAGQEAKPVAADGWQRVPKVPTEKMICAGIEAYRGKCEESYAAMLAAAPQEQAPLNAQALKNAYFGIKHALQQVAAARDVVAERQRQKDVEEWSEDHDDEHDDEALALAAAWYALPDVVRSALDVNDMSPWPQTWDLSYFKPGNRRRELVKAGALILAEIERIDRAAQQSQPQQVTK